jgi:hypothetical protein
MAMISQPLHPIQKTTFSNLQELTDWLDLVADLAGEPIKNIEVTKETYNMLITEWQAQRRYDWAKALKFSRPTEGTLEEIRSTINIETPSGICKIFCRDR